MIIKKFYKILLTTGGIKMGVMYNFSSGLYDSSRLYKPGMMTPVRTVGSYEIELYTYITDGFSVVNGIRYAHQPGNILIARPGDIRQSHIGQFRAYDVHFLSNDLILTGDYLDKFPTILHSADINRLTNIFTEIIYSHGKQKSDPGLYCIGKTYELISVINDIYKSNRQPDAAYSQHLNSINTCMEYMKTNYMKNITLQDISGIAYLSPTYFHLVFKSIVGMTPCSYMTEIRLEAAQKMLINSSKSLSEIAFECGFNSQAYFCSVFKSETGVTPKNFRAGKFIFLSNKSKTM
jgi:AraC-like DNA-binding protein